MVTDIIPMQEEEILIIINDVTEDRKRQEKLHLTDRLVSVGEMTSGIAHELNNPLTSVLGLSQLLKNEDIPAKFREDIEGIHREAQRAAEIVRNLLAFARRHAPAKAPTQINLVINDVLMLRAHEHQMDDEIESLVMSYRQEMA